jgi:signal transduction histidine kinase
MQAMQSRTASEFATELPPELMGRSIEYNAHGSSVSGCSASGCADGGIAEGAGLAHDAGNLLGALSLYSELLAMPGVLHEEHRGFAADLRLLSERSGAMIHRLVNHARIEQARGGARATVLPKLVERCHGVLSRVAGRAVDVSFGVGAYRPVDAQPEAVERILTNLVKNAAEAMPALGEIASGAIAVSVEGSLSIGRRRVLMKVRDTGCGMSRAAVERLMRTGGISSTSGRGLGFRVVRELVAMSGGCLTVESEPGAGTSISVEWYAIDAVDAVSPEVARDGLAGAMAC